MARRFFLHLNYFVCVTSLSRTCCAARGRSFNLTRAAFPLPVVVGDSACGTLVLTSFIRVPRVARSGIVADSHGNTIVACMSWRAPRTVANTRKGAVCARTHALRYLQTLQGRE